MELVSKFRCYGGEQNVYRHLSAVTGCEMTFAVYLPPKAKTERVPVLWYLSGLTCTHQNVMEKGEYRRAASDLGLIVVAPDTSPRGHSIPDEKDEWQIGSGAGFYVDATREPYASNYRMYSYILDELPALVAERLPIDSARQSIFGHSMGGHGALTLALKNPARYKSCSAFAPIVEPTTAALASKAYSRYFRSRDEGPAYDAVALIKAGHRFPRFLVDQGAEDQFLNESLRPWLLQDACKSAGIPLTLNMREGYDHSYFFISSFMSDHIEWHARQLK